VKKAVAIFRGLPQLPAQLTIRLTLLLCCLLGTNTLGFIELYRYHLRYNLAPRMGEAIADGIMALRASDNFLTDSERQQWLKQINRGHDNYLALLPAPPETDDDALNLFNSLLQSSIRQYAGADIRVEHEAFHNVLLVHFVNDGRHYRVSIPGSALGANDIWPFVWLIISNLLIVWASVLFAAWQINKPLQRSAQALENSSSRLAEIELPSSAPKEFRIFAERFNELAQRLAAQEKERALLLAGVSHDLRAPLTRIQLRAELMENTQNVQGTGLAMDAESMRHIIDQFLDYQRGNVEASAALIDLRLVTHELVERYAETGRDVRFSGAETVLVYADPSAIERILNNLIDNACTYGAQPVEVSLHRDHHLAVLEVLDHGPGIAEHEMNRLLQPFERLDTSRSLQGHCGLGLPIVNRLVGELKGTLKLSNRAGGGLRATIRLPLPNTTVA
jgi:two-component system osmolarity sensor histidine kinase EnvZ